MSVIWYALGFGFLSAIIAYVLALFGDRSRDKSPLAGAAIAGVLTVIIGGVLIWVRLPDFSHLMTGGYFWLGFIAVIVGLICGWGGSRGDNGVARIAILILLVVSVGRGLIVPMITAPYFCNTAANLEVVKLLHLRDASEGEVAHDLDINKAIKVSTSTARTKAARAVPTENNIGSYLEVSDPYLQNIQGSPMYVFSFNVKDWRGYKNYGGEVIPGFILVDATNPDSPAQYVQLPTNRPIRYVQGAGVVSSLDIDRYVYFQFALPRNVLLEELDGMEVDDNLHPWYTATIMRPVVGYTAYYPVGMIIIDPYSGDIQEYGINEIPSWVDRRLPKSTADFLVNWWASWAYHTPLCPFDNNAGKKKVDDEALVWSPSGIQFQYVLTSVGSDRVASDLIYVNPLTLAATRFSIQGVLQSDVQKSMVQRAKDFSRQEVVASNSQIEYVLGRQVWYAILENKESGSIWGVGLVQPKYTQSNTNSGVIVAPTLRAAYDQLSAQIAAEAAGVAPGQLSNSSAVVQVKGVVDRVGTPFPEGTDWYVPFTLKVEGQSGLLWFKAKATDAQVQMMHERDNVTVSAVTAATEVINQVISVTNHTYPPK